MSGTKGNGFTRILTTGLIALLAVLVVIQPGHQAGHAAVRTVTPLVTICAAQPCANFQELTVSDAGTATRGPAPIFTVPEAGGPEVLGDKFSVIGILHCPSSTYCWASHVWVISPWSPDQYPVHDGGTYPSCVAPSIWQTPGFYGVLTWYCNSSGTWTQEKS